MRSKITPFVNRPDQLLHDSALGLDADTIGEHRGLAVGRGDHMPHLDVPALGLEPEPDAEGR